MGIISCQIPDMDGPGKLESFGSRIGDSHSNPYLFVSKSDTIKGGCTHVTCTFEPGKAGARPSETRPSKPLPNLLRRTSCLAVSILSLSSRLSGSWLPVRRRHLSRNQSWFRSLKTCRCQSIDQPTAGRARLALLILPRFSGVKPC